MSVISIIAKTTVKVVYGVLQIVGVLGEGVTKLSTKTADNLVDLDKKLTKRFEEKKDKIST